MQISNEQLKLVNDRIKALVNSGSFYGKKLAEAGISEVNTPEDFLRLPFSEKNDLREAYHSPRKPLWNNPNPLPSKKPPRNSPSRLPSRKPPRLKAPSPRELARRQARLSDHVRTLL